MISLQENLFYIASCALAIAFLSGFSTSLQILGRLRGKEEILTKGHFLYFSLYSSWESLLFAVNFCKTSCYILFFYLIQNRFLSLLPPSFSPFWEMGLLLLFAFSLKVLFNLSWKNHPERGIHLFSFPTSILLIPFIPLFMVYKYINRYTSQAQGAFRLPFRLQDRLSEYLQESDLGRYLDKTETKLIHTVISFKDRIVREVMVPRIDVFSLPIETSIQEAAHHFSREGYSRIPVYKDSVDKICGILLYKDVLSIYTKHVENKEPKTTLYKTVEQLIKPALYTPETKKISQLLQEFRLKQIHLAIVVDEYGGTEGIVTIEDILEELVGEIEDEYDIPEEKSFLPLSSGGWIVDAKMSILDLEEDLGIKIAGSTEYDTIGGFISHKTGSIPEKGWKAHLDDIDLEILTSDERSIQKIKITPRDLKETTKLKNNSPHLKTKTL
jgi:putative hemolysin